MDPVDVEMERRCLPSRVCPVCNHSYGPLPSRHWAVCLTGVCHQRREMHESLTEDGYYITCCGGAIFWTMPDSLREGQA